jgi:5-methylcytosine-specific restriction protein A
MATSALRPCTYPGCGVLVVRGRCVAHTVHTRALAERDRASAHARGYGARWNRARVEWLREHPLCVNGGEVAGCRFTGSTVDHIKPHRGDPELFWDRENWQTMCAPCHSAKTAAEDGGFGNRAKVT